MLDLTAVTLGKGLDEIQASSIRGDHDIQFLLRQSITFILLKAVVLSTAGTTMLLEIPFSSFHMLVFEYSGSISGWTYRLLEPSSVTTDTLMSLSKYSGLSKSIMYTLVPPATSRSI